MEAREQNTAMTILPMNGRVLSPLVIPNLEDDQNNNENDAAGDNFETDRHPNFIESNTQGITLRELTENNIIPTFCDNTLTISHQNFISAVSQAASKVFGELTYPGRWEYDR